MSEALEAGQCNSVLSYIHSSELAGNSPKSTGGLHLHNIPISIYKETKVQLNSLVLNLAHIISQLPPTLLQTIGQRSPPPSKEGIDNT